MENKKLNLFLYIAEGLLVIAIIVMLVLMFMSRKGNDEDTIAQQTSETQIEENNGSVEKWQEGDISYNGVTYRYNAGIKTYLFMGIDKSGEVAEGEDGIDGGQSDAMFLLVTDATNKTISVISINRNTMATVDVYDREGNYRGQAQLQICLQHGYGDGLRTSCLRASNAVSRLFDNIPINGYFSLNMEAMPILNDAVGGVTVEVMHDLESETFGVSLKKGETVTLTGQEAYAYIRYRDVNEFDSASKRLARQNQYLLSLLTKLENSAMKDEASIMSVYNQLEDYIVTNIDFVKLAEDVSEYEFDASQMYDVPGETIMGERFEEYYVDEYEMYDMIINIFYEEVEE